MNSLAIATFHKDVIVQNTVCLIIRNISTKVTQDLSFIHLQSKDKQVVPNFKHFYSGLSMLGKHFLVRTVDKDRTARHYTICNVLRPKVYDELIRLLRTDDKNMTKLFNLLDNKDTNSVMFLVKRYESPTGVSLKLHTD